MEKKGFMYYFDLVEEKFLVYSFALSIALIAVQVFMRFVFNNSLSWSEELARYLFIWQGWLGVSLCERYKQHISIEVIKNLLKEPANKFLECVALLCALGCALVLAFNGAVLIEKLFRSGTQSTALGIPMFIVYAAMPLGCLAYSLRTVIRILGLFCPDKSKAV